MGLRGGRRCPAEWEGGAGKEGGISRARLRRLYGPEVKADLRTRGRCDERKSKQMSRRSALGSRRARSLYSRVHDRVRFLFLAPRSHVLDRIVTHEVLMPPACYTVL